MAGSEIYRVEIPIIVEDQTEAPLKQAEQRINRLEQSAQKTNNRIRKMFGRSIRLSIGAIDKAWPVIKGIQTRLRGLTARAWKITLQAKDKVTGTIKSIFRTLTSPLALLGAGAGATAAIYGPLKIAGEMEQARIAMDYFMGSAEEGKRALEELLEFAATTPFEFPALQEATIMLMGADYTFDQAKRALRAFGDTAGMTGAGMQGMQDAMLGFTQIAAAGTLNLQDLRQVALNLRVPLTAFAEELGVAKEQMGDIGKAGIPAAKAMEAIVRTLEKRYAGGMEKLSKSLLGLVSTLKDTARLTVSAFGTGMADPVKRILADMLGMADYTSESYRKMTVRLEDFGRRVGRKFEQIYERIKRFYQDISGMPEFEKADPIQKLIIMVERGLPEIAEAGTKLGAKLAVGIVSGITSAVMEDPLVAGILGAWLAIKIPGPVGITIGITIAALPWIEKFLESVFGGAGEHIPGTQFYVEKRIDEITETQRRIEEAKKTIPPEEPLIGGTSIRSWPSMGASKWLEKNSPLQSLRAFAVGGILDRPHFGLIAEEGPEAIIPLSARMRPRGLELWEETGRRLGIRPYAEGGFAGSVPVLAATTTPGATINMNFDFAGLVRQIVVNNQHDIEKAIDEITSTIADNLQHVFGNMIQK